MYLIKHPKLERNFSFLTVNSQIIFLHYSNYNWTCVKDIDIPCDMHSYGPFTLTLSQHQFDTNMPVHRDQEKKESAAADMEVEEHEHEASSTEEEDSDTTSVSEDGESSGEEPLHSTAFPFSWMQLSDFILGLSDYSERDKGRDKALLYI